MPISVADLATELFPKMFPNSKSAQGYMSKCTKTTAIANTLGRFEKNDILKNLECLPFSPATDGSNAPLLMVCHCVMLH